jgi:MFS family permease
MTGNTFLVGGYQSVANVGAASAMLYFGAVSDRSAVARRKVALGALLCLAMASLLLAVAVAVDSALMLAGAGVLATSTAWTISGQVTPLAKRAARQGEESQLMSIVVSAWAVGALVGSQVHGRLAERHPTELFLFLAMVLLLAFGMANLMFRAMHLQ